MDNLNASDPQGEADVTASSGQSENDETQTAETEEGVDETQSEEAGEQYPWEKDERFRGKTPEDIWNTYQDSQKAIGQASQKAELVNLLEKHTGMSSSQIRDFIARRENEQLAQQAQTNPMAYLAQEVNSLKGQIAYQNEEKALDKFLSTEEGKAYAPFKEDIMEFAFMPKYQDMSFDEIAKSKFGNAIAQGQKTAYQKIETKKATQATRAMSQPQKKFTLEDMKNMSSKELEQILPHAPKRF